MFEPKNDGIDHINIYSKGKTEIGKWLSNFAFSPIEIPHHGYFNSIEGYWYWLGTRDERLRSLYGYQAKKLGEVLHNKKVENFEKYIKKALDIKLKSDKEMMHKFSESTLPFTHYYVFGEIKKEAGFEWIVKHFESRRKLLKKWFFNNHSR